jgi:hypothetical protein
MSYVWAIQRNGERISIDTWAYQDYIRGKLKDPLIAHFINAAIKIDLSPGWPKPM